jgi:aryl-alcohol dehydrogenase-like predicted oxidoreductase
LIGANSPEKLEQNAQSLERLDFSHEELSEIGRILSDHY